MNYSRERNRLRECFNYLILTQTLTKVANAFHLQILPNIPWVELLTYPKYFTYHTLCTEDIYPFFSWTLTHGVVLTHLLQTALQSVNVYMEVLQNILTESKVKITISWTDNVKSVFNSMFQTAVLPVVEFRKQHICLLWMHSKSGVFDLPDIQQNQQAAA